MRYEFEIDYLLDIHSQYPAGCTPIVIMGCICRTWGAFAASPYVTLKFTAEIGAVEALAFSGPRIAVRTIECVPSVPTSRVPVAFVPSLNVTVTPEPSASYSIFSRGFPYCSNSGQLISSYSSELLDIT